MSFSVTHTRIGSGNVFREYATVNASSTPGESTVVGNNGLFLSYSHIAHDCIIGNDVVISCDSKLSGHVQVDDHAIINAPLRDAIAQLQSEFAGQSDVSTMISFAATSALGLARPRMMGKNPNE